MEWIAFDDEKPKNTGLYLTTCRIHEEVVDEYWVEILRWQEEDGVYFWEHPDTDQKKTVIAWMPKPKPYRKEVA